MQHIVVLSIDSGDPSLTDFHHGLLGDYGVTAFASLSIVDGDRVVRDYTAKAHVTKSYSLYSEPTHQELERAARTAVRKTIDQKLYRDAAQLAAAVASHGPAATGSDR